MSSMGKKLVFLGDSGVGKTCMIARFISGFYDDTIYVTIGASYASKTIEIPEIGKSITLDVWDTAGQERYRALNKFYYQGAKMVILVYDITRKDTFDNLKNCWYKDLKEKGDPNIVIGIAGSKSDLYDNEAVPEQEAREFAKSIDAVFGLTSARNNTGIDELFKELGKKFLNLNNSEIESDIQKQDKKQEIIQSIKLDDKNADKKNKEQKKKKKNFC